MMARSEPWRNIPGNRFLIDNGFVGVINTRHVITLKAVARISFFKLALCPIMPFPRAKCSEWQPLSSSNLVSMIIIHLTESCTH